MNYTPLYIKTDYSLLSSLITIDELIKYAKDYNITSISITDDNMSGTIEFYNKCIQNSIKPIIGLEVLTNDTKILLYAKDYDGYKSLIKLSTIKTERPITNVDLKTNNHNVICIVPYLYKDNYIDLKTIYVDIFLGYKNNTEKQELLKLTSNIVYINETMYFEEYQAVFLSHANLIRDGKKIDALDEYKYTDNHLLKPSLIDFNDTKSTNAIASMCNISFKQNVDLMPVFTTENGMDPKEYLIELSKLGLSRRLNNKVTKEYADRLFYELDIITSLNFANYFLIVSDYVKYAKKNNISVGPGRGSAASSLVSYSLGITDIDPIKYNLLFERFLNPERISMPDIDIDFEDERRDEVIKYVTNKYGNKKVAGIITYGTLGAKLVIRDVSRLFDLPIKLVDRINSFIPTVTDLKLGDLYKENKKLKELIDSSVDLKQMYKVAIALENKKRHTSVHAAGIIMSFVNLDEAVPLYKNDEGYIVGYTMDYLEQLGLLKMDFLGLKNLTIIKKIINDISINEGINLNLNELSDDDECSIYVFTEVNTIGIFQFESEGMKNFLRKLKIKSFEEVIAAIALFRPGPMENINLYITNRNNPTKVDYIHNDLKPILEPTYGVIIYQEQIMQIASIMASYTLGEADVLRRAMSKKKKDVMANEQTKFMERAIAKGYDKDVALNVFNLILKFADYGFNRAHSVSYSKISFQMAYLKSHYPKYFMACLLNNAINSDSKIKEYIHETKQNLIDITPPSINNSDYRFKVENNKILYSLSAIKNVGYAAIKEIFDERNKKTFSDFFNFVARCYGRSLNKKVIESLIDASAFDEFNYNKNTLHHNLDAAINYAELIKDLNEDYVEKPVMVVVNEYDKDTLMKNEFNSFGFYINGSPVEKYRDNSINTVNIKKYFDKRIDIYVQIDNLKKIRTKKNDQMCFVTGSDELSTIDIILFPETYKNYENIKIGNIIKVNGKVEKRLAQYQIIVNTIDILE